jgi:uncharacterized protein YndB with AHSA1/START domain
MTTKNETQPPKTQAHLPPPPAPEGKPFQVGLTTALVQTDAARTVTHRLKRVIKAPPQKVYDAFVDPDALAAWLPPHGFMGKTHRMDARVGGGFRMSFYTATKSWSSTFDAKFHELVPGKRIVHTNFFADDGTGKPAEIRATVTLTPVEEGTLVEVEHVGPAGPMMGGAPYGWSQSFEKLALLVEPELPF